MLIPGKGGGRPVKREHASWMGALEEKGKVPDTSVASEQREVVFGRILCKKAPEGSGPRKGGKRTGKRRNIEKVPTTLGKFLGQGWHE